MDNTQEVIDVARATVVAWDCWAETKGYDNPQFDELIMAMVNMAKELGYTFSWERTTTESDR